MTWKSNSGFALVAAGILLIILAALAFITPQWGLYLQFCSAGTILLLAFSAIHWAIKENNRPRFVVPTALGIVLIGGILLCSSTPEPSHSLTMNDQEKIYLGQRYDEIAWIFGEGEWISDAEVFSVSYDVERCMHLVLVFEDGVILSSKILMTSEEKCN